MLSARRKALLNSLFEMWDNDGSGFLDLDEVETVMKKYKGGVEMDAIAKGLYSNASPYLRCAGAGQGGASGFMDCSNIMVHSHCPRLTQRLGLTLVVWVQHPMLVSVLVQCEDFCLISLHPFVNKFCV